jgi:hypothetical protein
MVTIDGPVAVVNKVGSVPVNGGAIDITGLSNTRSFPRTLSLGSNMTAEFSAVTITVTVQQQFACTAPRPTPSPAPT